MKRHEAEKTYHMVNYWSKWYAPIFYTVPEVAVTLKVTPETVLNYIFAGEMTAEKLGNTYRITVEDLKDFLISKSEGLLLKRERRCTV
ncbi:MAG TPA: helix-turn-helix domain-containing protein [Bacillota bacterium]|jgi:excisionase family DNA binding protein|nr:helix-turn-helix domain-containing protein [Bacillota bacterium]